MEYVRQIAGKYHILLRERYNRKIILNHHIFHHYKQLVRLNLRKFKHMRKLYSTINIMTSLGLFLIGILGLSC